MKNIYIKALVAIFFVSAYSCSSDWLDTNPSDSIEASEAITTVKKANVVLAGVYDALQGRSTPSGSTTTYPYYYGSRMIYYGDVRSDDMQSREGGKRTSPTYEMNYTANTTLRIWDEPYRVIRRANNLIEAIDNGYILDVTDIDKDKEKKKQEEVNHIKGQALMARAIAHFDLLRVYSLPYEVDKNGDKLGIPIVTKPLDASATPGRNTIKEVYDQVEKDLIDAIAIISNKHATGYFNAWAGKALLARVYLYKGTAADNKKAYDTALDVINNSTYKLWATDSYVSSWAKQGTSEVIFEIVSTGTEDWVDRESIGYLYSEEGYSDAIMTKNYVNFVEATYANDVRLDVMKKAVAASAKGKEYEGRNVYINKYPGREGTNDPRHNNVPVLRLSEMYLIASEAAQKLGDATNAAKYLNTIVKRGNPAAAEISPANATLARILQENRVEFVGEGHRYFDLIRNNQKVVRYTSEADKGWHVSLELDSRSFDRTYYRAILPIPEKEVLANPIIAQQQNTGY